MQPELLTITIEDLSSSGQGVGKHNGQVVFVDKATIGDVVIAEVREAKQNYLKAKLINIRNPSVNRVQPLCKHFDSCGSCQLQNLDYPAQLEFKQNLIKENLIRIGNFDKDTLPEIKTNGSSETYYYRNKSQLPLAQSGKQCQIGYYRQNSHQLVDLQECHLHHQDFMSTIKLVKEFINHHSLSIYNEQKHSGLLRHIVLRKSDYLQELQLTLVINNNHFPLDSEIDSLVEKINSQLQKYQLTSVFFNINKNRGNRIFGEKSKLLSGQEYISEKVGDHFFRISPNTFLQINLNQAQKMYQQLKNALPDNINSIADLYCGIGTITLNLADKATHIIGVEENPQAVKDAKQNARNNNVTNCTFICSKSEQLDISQLKIEGQSPEIVIVDPPRKGLDPQVIELIVKLQPSKLFYISCNPATLARDLKSLCVDNLFTIGKISAYDFFPQTTHIETLVELQLNS